MDFTRFLYRIGAILVTATLLTGCGLLGNDRPAPGADWGVVDPERSTGLSALPLEQPRVGGFPADPSASPLPASPLVSAFESTGLRKVALTASDLDDINLCEGLVTHNEREYVKPVAKPPYLKYYREPAFGTKVIRISNANAQEVYKPAYSTMQAWNADESLLLLYHSGSGDAGHVLFDGHSYQPIKSLDIVPTDLEEVFWSHTDPNTFFYVSKYSRDYGILKKYDVRADKSTKIKSFEKVCGARGLPVGGGDVHMQSLDDDLFGFRCRDDDDRWQMFTYRISTDEIVVQPIGDNTAFDAWTAPMPGPSGKRLWMQGRSLALDLKTVEKTMDMAKDHEHSNLGRTHAGQDALFQTVFDPSPNGCDGGTWQGVGHLVEHNLETGECRPIITEDKGYPYTTSGTHVSAQAYRRPGWIAMSSIGYDQFQWFTNGRKAPALFSEIYLVNTDPENETVCRLAQHRSFAKHAKNAQYKPYFGEPHATISPSGTRIIFGSDWYDSGAVDSYVIELPAYQRPQ